MSPRARVTACYLLTTAGSLVCLTRLKCCINSTVSTSCPYRACPFLGPSSDEVDAVRAVGSDMSATDIISASCVHSAGKNRATEYNAQSWFAIVRSFIDAAHVKTGLKNALGQRCAALSRKSESGAQGSSGGSSVNRC